MASSLPKDIWSVLVTTFAQVVLKVQLWTTEKTGNGTRLDWLAIGLQLLVARFLR